MKRISIIYGKLRISHTNDDLNITALRAAEKLRRNLVLFLPAASSAEGCNEEEYETGSSSATKAGLKHAKSLPLPRFLGASIDTT